MSDDMVLLDQIEQDRAQQEQQQRTFPLAGETFTHRVFILPEVAYRFEQMQLRYSAELTAVKAEMKKLEKNEAADIDMTVLEKLTPDWDLIRSADEFVRACLEPESLPAWERLRSEDHPHPLSFQHVFQVAGFLLGRVTRIPTDAPIDSSDGRTTTDKTSKDTSSSQGKTQTKSPSATS